ncbi:MAG: DEAD/DEAH box helicase [Acidimicrobiales bacterium]
MTQTTLAHVDQKIRPPLSDVLYRYQKVGANYLFSRERALLADQMGLGKSVQAIAALRKTEGTIVVCPASLVVNWQREFDKFRPELRVSPWEDFGAFPGPGEVGVTTYSRLPDADMRCRRCEGTKCRPCHHCEGIGCELCGYIGNLDCAECGGTGRGIFPRWAGNRPSHPVTVVFDEAHYLKSSKARRTLAARALAATCKRCWLLTGTPLMNHPPELWSLLQACKWSAKDVFGSYENFVQLFDGKRLRYGGYEWGSHVSPEAKSRLEGFMLRRTRKEVLSELPEKTYRDLEVELSKTDLKGHDFSFLHTWGDDQVLDECQEGGRLFSVRQQLAHAKHEALGEILETFEQEGEPVVVFSQHKVLIDDLRSRKGWACITGEDHPIDRDRAVRLFQDGALFGIAGTIGAMGVGLTLTRAAQEVFVDQSWNPAENAQAEDRCCRIGQTRGVVVTRLVSNHPVDKRVCEVLTKKRAMLESAGLL